MNFSKSFKFTIIAISLLIYLSCSTVTQAKWIVCYIPAFLNASWTDTHPIYRINITSDRQGHIRYMTWVTREITKPYIHFVLTFKGNNKRATVVLYNITTQLCDIRTLFNEIPMIKQGFRALTKDGNFTFTCPLKAGYYFMENQNFWQRNPVMAFMYRPNVSFVINGGVYEDDGQKTLVALGTYEFAFKIDKKSCN